MKRKEDALEEARGILEELWLAKEMAQAACWTEVWYDPEDQEFHRLQFISENEWCETPEHWIHVDRIPPNRTEGPEDGVDEDDLRELMYDFITERVENFEEWLDRSGPLNEQRDTRDPWQP